MSSENIESGLDKAISAAGGAASLARACRVTPQAVDKWKRRVPAERVREIVAAVQGEVTPHDLRPDLYPEGFEFPGVAA